MIEHTLKQELGVPVRKEIYKDVLNAVLDAELDFETAYETNTQPKGKYLYEEKPIGINSVYAYLPGAGYVYVGLWNRSLKIFTPNLKTRGGK